MAAKQNSGYKVALFLVFSKFFSGDVSFSSNLDVGTPDPSLSSFTLVHLFTYSCMVVNDNFKEGTKGIRMIKYSDISKSQKIVLFNIVQLFFFFTFTN